MSEAAAAAGMAEEEVDNMLGRCRQLLHGLRAKRPRPSLDDKVGGGGRWGGGKGGGRGVCLGWMEEMGVREVTSSGWSVIAMDWIRYGWVEEPSLDDKVGVLGREDGWGKE